MRNQINDEFDRDFPILILINAVVGGAALGWIIWLLVNQVFGA